MITYDANFADLIKRAGHAFVNAKGKDPAIEGSELAELLRSDAPLGAGERELLAQLVTGDLRRPTKKQRPSWEIRQNIVNFYISRLINRGDEESAAIETAEQFKVSKSKVRAYRKEIRDREIANSTAKANLSK